VEDLCEILNFKTKTKYPGSVDLELNQQLRDKVSEYLNHLYEACREIKRDLDSRKVKQSSLKKNLQKVLEK
jgi:hypothetical protein